MDAGSGSVDNTRAMLGMQSHGTEVTDTARNNKPSQQGLKSVACILGVKHRPRSLLFLLVLACAEYEAVGDKDAIIDVYSRLDRMEDGLGIVRRNEECCRVQ